jgi:hypothetical protein
VGSRVSSGRFVGDHVLPVHTRVYRASGNVLEVLGIQLVDRGRRFVNGFSHVKVIRIREGWLPGKCVNSPEKRPSLVFSRHGRFLTTLWPDLNLDSKATCSDCLLVYAPVIDDMGYG